MCRVIVISRKSLTNWHFGCLPRFQTQKRKTGNSRTVTKGEWTSEINSTNRTTRVILNVSCLVVLNAPSELGFTTLSGVQDKLWPGQSYLHPGKPAVHITRRNAVICPDLYITDGVKVKNQPKRLLVWWVDSGLNQLALSSSFFGDVLGFQERERERERANN